MPSPVSLYRCLGLSLTSGAQFLFMDEDKGTGIRDDFWVGREGEGMSYPFSSLCTALPQIWTMLLETHFCTLFYA